ncbi:MAG: hypothetical protein C4K60_16360 [Ideonella sp. MAG2]|nr:MAG: hypothetical protein C4K60_16360 [Ideonella sp. MAG2]
MVPALTSSICLVAADTRTPQLACLALERCLDAMPFEQTILFAPHGFSYQGRYAISVHAVDAFNSVKDYSAFILNELPGHVNSSHCLIVQWDGFISHPNAWTDQFLSVDYIGAVWPQYKDSHRVGNGGFSLRSAKLMKEVQQRFGAWQGEAEDVFIARSLRQVLETDAHCQFADEALAHQFSAERSGHIESSFGFHGLGHLPDVLRPEELAVFLEHIPPSAFCSTEGRSFIKSLLRLGRIEEAQKALASRQALQGASLGNARLWARITLLNILRKAGLAA